MDWSDSQAPSPMPFPEQVTPNSPAAGCNASFSPDYANQNPGFNGPFNDSGVRFLIVMDAQNLVMRAYQRIAGVWSEADAANAPAIAIDGGISPAPGVYQYYSVQQVIATRFLYVVRWDPVSFLIKATKFNTATAKWGADVVSVLGYTFGGAPGAASENAGFQTQLRNDGIMWVSWTAGVDGGGTCLVNGAKLNTATDTWDAAPTIISDTAIDQTTHACVGMAIDGTQNIACIFFKRFPLPLPGNNSQIYMKVIHPDNSIGVHSTIATTPSPAIEPRFNGTSKPWISEANVLTVLTHQAIPNAFTSKCRVFRGQMPNDNPAWEETQPAELQNIQGIDKSPVSANGKDLIFFQKSNAGNRESRYIQSDGIGQPWNASVLVGSAPTGNLFVVGLVTQLAP